MMKSTLTNSFIGRGGNAAGIVFLLFFATFWSGITLSFDFFIVKGMIQQIQAINYSTTIGTITSSNVKVSSDGESTSYQAEIKYAYTVDGKQYTGDRYRYGQWSSGDNSAQRIVASLPAGKQVDIYYAPRNPKDAVLHKGIEGADLFLLMFMWPFNLVMLSLWMAILGSVRYRLFRPVAGGAKIIDDGRCLRVRLSPLRPAYIGAGFSGGMAFLLVFIVGFGFGFNPPMAMMIGVWGLILGGSAIGSFFAQRKLSRGDSDLVIDDTSGTVVLPRTCGRREEVVVRTNAIVACELDQGIKRISDDGVQHTYIPTITFTNDDGSQRKEKLIEWHDKTAAEGLVEWLRERLWIKPSSEIGS